jgi:hypothetical protein
MSKNSAKSMYSQLMEWIPTLGRTMVPKTATITKQIQQS